MATSVSSTFSGVMRSILLLIILGLTLATLILVLDRQFANPNLGVRVLLMEPDGSFSSPLGLPVDTQEVFWGDTMIWRGLDVDGVVDPVIPIYEPMFFHNSQDLSYSYKPYEADNPNEFTGPMPQAAPGIFALSPEGAAGIDGHLGFVPDPITGDLSRGTVPFATMDTTWQTDSIAGVFIRMRWNQVHLGPDQYDWRTMDREIKKAVRNGKFYNLGFVAGTRGTPRWIFNDTITGPGMDAKLHYFRDWGSTSDVPNSCGFRAWLGSPTDENYKHHYFTMLQAAGEHIRANNAWYRALAYVKLSAANLITHENRLPRRINDTLTIASNPSLNVSNCINNPQVWADSAGYTPMGLHAFYSEQSAVMAEAFPTKTQSYMLIQAGFPRVNDIGEWDLGGEFEIPRASLFTEMVVRRLIAERQMGIAIAHNGLGPYTGSPPCATAGTAGNSCPNYWVRMVERAGYVTGHQTVNTTSYGSRTPEELDLTLQNAFTHSEGIYVEVYEETLYDYENNRVAPTPPLRIGEWNQRFLDRRRGRLVDAGLPDPNPSFHQHVFQKPEGEVSDTTYFYFVNGNAVFDNPTNYGVLMVVDPPE